MIYTPLTKKAMKIAYDAHRGQVDAGGVPYVFHPLHLAEQMEDEASACVALLHDIVEDTDVTLEQLAQDFPPEVIQAVALLTHNPQESYFEYVRKIRGNRIATVVKLADLEHNSDETRLLGVESVAERQKEVWRVKYQEARKILLDRSSGT
ncbi:MAG: bifunctional (p)ppGpp synthetase/guanosine-3',5'-bis(diphosphate) 3'-pyrophosphohydrolase [Lachnospiraceae bacterium]|nr:bifunctional (p)ppGpp synthetase/guanosine-3',5'-bis(diphosphate) 3'-pyrophosphohydrolase [Lachnospiraceae bacterium]